MREIEFRCWNDIDKMMIEWRTLRASPIFFMNVIKGAVKHHTLEQYTGLKDCNGVKIFEGDTVGTDLEVGNVKYINEQAAFCLVDDGDFICLLSNAINYEVIGNIHEVQS